MSNLNARPSATFTAPLNGAPQGATFDVGIYTDPEGDEHTAPVSTGITEYERPDNLSNYRASRTAPDTAGEFEVRWYDEDGNIVGTDSLHVGHDVFIAGFGTADDVETRLNGRTLTAGERATAESVIATVTAQIADAVDRDLVWAADLDPVPPLLTALCVEKALAAVSNPTAVVAESLGAHSVTYGRQNGSSVLLTDQEGRMARMAVYGTLSGSSTPRALEDRLIDLRENRDVDEPE